MLRRPCKLCRDPILFVKSASTGRFMALDAEPDAERGNVLVDERDLAHVLDADAARIVRQQGEDLHLAHQASCEPYIAGQRTA